MVVMVLVRYSMGPGTSSKLLATGLFTFLRILMYGYMGLLIGSQHLRRFAEGSFMKVIFGKARRYNESSQCTGGLCETNAMPTWHVLQSF